MKRKYVPLCIALLIGISLGGCDLVNIWEGDGDGHSDDASWEYLGLEGVEVNRLRYYHPYLYVISRQQGLWRMREGERNAQWRFLGQADTVVTEEGVPFTALLDVVQHPRNPNRLMVAREKNCCNGTWQPVFQSDDGGRTWTPNTAGVEETLRMGNTEYTFYGTVRNFAWVDDTVIGLDPSLKVSSDFGRSWDVRAEAAPLADFYRQHPMYPKVVWSGSDKEFFDDAITLSVSTDGTASWKSVDVLGGPGINGHRGIGSVAFDAADPRVAYAGIEVDQLLLKTTDGGITWDSLNTSAFGDCCVLVAGSLQKSGEVWASNGKQLLHSINGGHTWTLLETPFAEHATITTLDWGGADGHLIVATSQGLFTLQRRR